MEKNNFFIQLLKKNVVNDPLIGFDFDIEQIRSLYENALDEYDKNKDVVNTDRCIENPTKCILQLLSNIVRNIPLSNVDPNKLRWFDIQSAIYNTDNLGASVIPSLQTVIPNKAMILCQAPTHDHMCTFLENQIERNIQTFVVLETKADTHIGNMITHNKYYKYWSHKKNKSKKFDKIIIKTLNIKKIKNINIIDITITNHNTGLIHHAKIIHYTAWPDMGVISVEELDSLVQIINIHTVTENKLLIHCSAGVGRAGTLCASLLLNNFIADELNLIHIDELVLFLKICRPYTIQTTAQYRLIADYAKSIKKN